MYLFFHQQVHSWALQMCISETWNTVPHLMDLLLCLMMVKLDLLHQYPVDLLQRYDLFTLDVIFFILHLLILVFVIKSSPIFLFMILGVVNF